MKRLFELFGGLLRWLVVIVVAGVAFLLIAEYWANVSQYGDDGGNDRGAAVARDQSVAKFNDQADKVVYLQQGWSPEQSVWFYNTTQGSDLLPYDFFLELEQADSTELFRAAVNIDRYRYLPQNPSSSNPDGLPVGMVKDSYKDKEYMGFTCAACHTGQVNYQGTAMRIDGGPAASDMVGFLKGLREALTATKEDADKRKRFVERVIAHGTYDSEDEVLADLDTCIVRLTMYNIINHSDSEYGYARLDAFGRIFNRVIEHLLTPEDLRALLGRLFSPAEVDEVLAGTDKVLTSDERDAIVVRAVKLMMSKGKTGEEAIQALVDTVGADVFVTADAPVSYPFLWDIPQHDYVQWNGIGGNGGIGPLGRNTGEVIGVFATLDFGETRGLNLGGVVTGQGGFLDGKKSVRFDSSVNVRNLRRIEQQLGDLTSPQWPADLVTGFPALDEARVARGEAIYEEYCVACHHHIDRTSPDRRVVAFMTDVARIRTDPGMVVNSVSDLGPSGFAQNLYVGAGPGSLLMQEKAPVATLLTMTTMGVVTTPDPDTFYPLAVLNLGYDLFSAYINNPIKDSLKRGEYRPSTTVDPYNPLLAYKGRPLNGIWATAPYLHNGSVPTLYDLMLPKKREGAPEDGEYRPDSFMVGSREFDPVKVGFQSAGYNGFLFDTSKHANSNGGHEYAAGRTPQPGQREPLPALGKEQRLDLLEYLKSL